MTREVFTGFVAEESVRRRDAGSPQIRASGGARGAPQGADGGGRGMAALVAVGEKLTQEKEMAR